MHSLFLDEAYHDVESGRIIVVGAWAADQARLASHAHLLGELRQRGKSPLLNRIATVSSIDARGRLYFKGGNGEGAWPTQVEKVAATRSSG